MTGTAAGEDTVVATLDSSSFNGTISQQDGRQQREKSKRLSCPLAKSYQRGKDERVNLLFFSETILLPSLKLCEIQEEGTGKDLWMWQRLNLRTALEAQFRPCFLEDIQVYQEPDILSAFWSWHTRCDFWQAWLTTQLCETCPWTSKHNILLLSVCEDLAFIASQGAETIPHHYFPASRLARLSVIFVVTSRGAVSRLTRRTVTVHWGNI